MDNSPLQQFTELRPWGQFTQFTHNEPSTVEIINVDAGHSLSLQFHRHRSEYWYVISGTGTAVIGKQLIDLVVGQTYTVPVTVHHRISATTQLQILEIGIGMFDELDIVRLSDNYGRQVS